MLFRSCVPAVGPADGWHLYGRGTPPLGSCKYSNPILISPYCVAGSCERLIKCFVKFSCIKDESAAGEDAGTAGGIGDVTGDDSGGVGGIDQP